MEQPGGGGGIWQTRVVGIRCVHYIEQKDCTVRFARYIWYIYMVYERFPKENQIDTSHTGGTVQGRAPQRSILYLLYGCTVVASLLVLARKSWYKFCENLAQNSTINLLRVPYRITGSEFNFRKLCCGAESYLVGSDFLKSLNSNLGFRHRRK